MGEGAATYPWTRHCGRVKSTTARHVSSAAWYDQYWTVSGGAARGSGRAEITVAEEDA